MARLPARERRGLSHDGTPEARPLGGAPLASPLLDSLPPQNIPQGAQGKTRPGGQTGTP